METRCKYISIWLFGKVSARLRKRNSIEWIMTPLPPPDQFIHLFGINSMQIPKVMVAQKCCSANFVWFTTWKKSRELPKWSDSTRVSIWIVQQLLINKWNEMAQMQPTYRMNSKNLDPDIEYEADFRLGTSVDWRMSNKIDSFGIFCAILSSFEGPSCIWFSTQALWRPDQLGHPNWPFVAALKTYANEWVKKSYSRHFYKSPKRDCKLSIWFHTQLGVWALRFSYNSFRFSRTMSNVFCPFGVQILKPTNAIPNAEIWKNFSVLILLFELCAMPTTCQLVLPTYERTVAYNLCTGFLLWRNNYYPQTS